MKIDHLILAAVDLDAAAQRVEREHGLRSLPGGAHPGLGTANRLIPLGDAYIELMGICDHGLAEQNPLGQTVIERDGSWLGWCLSVDDVDAVADRLKLAAAPMSRIKPDGNEISWRLAGLDVSLHEPELPFFIQWDDPARRPGLDKLEQPVAIDGISWLAVAGDRERIAQWLAGSHLPLRIVDGSGGLQAAALASAGGEIVIG